MNRANTQSAIDCADIEKFLGVPLPPDLSAGDENRLLKRSDMQHLMLERPPFFFIKRAVAIKQNGCWNEVWGVADMDEERSNGHFPNRPIVPLIELCKSIAQTGIILVSLYGDESQAPIAVKAGESEALAKKLIVAPVTILIKVTLSKMKFNKVFLLDGVTYLNGQAIGSLAQVQYLLMDRQTILGEVG